MTDRSLDAPSGTLLLEYIDFACFLTGVTERTDQRTDGRTGERTDRPVYRDARKYLKRERAIARACESQSVRLSECARSSESVSARSSENVSARASESVSVRANESVTLFLRSNTPNLSF